MGFKKYKDVVLSIPSKWQ